MRPVGLRVGRFFAWFAFLWMIGGLALLFIVPPLARLFTCTSGTKPCTAWAFTAIPWWWGMLWSVSLVVAIAVCWPPSRWWTPQDRSGRPRIPGVFSTPEWLRLHAVVAFGAGLLAAAQFTPTAADLVGYGASALVAAGGVALATMCIRRTAAHIPAALHRGIAQGFDFWLLPSEHRLRARYGGPPALPEPTPAVRADRARRRTRASLSYAAWCYAWLCGLPILLTAAVLLIFRPYPQPGPVVLLFALAWVPWALTVTILIVFLSGIRYPMPGRRGGERVAMLVLLALGALGAAWYFFIGTPFYGGFTWGLDVLFVVQAVLAGAIVVRMIVRST